MAWKNSHHQFIFYQIQHEVVFQHGSTKQRCSSLRENDFWKMSHIRVLQFFCSVFAFVSGFQQSFKVFCVILGCLNVVLFKPSQHDTNLPLFARWSAKWITAVLLKPKSTTFEHMAMIILHSCRYMYCLNIPIIMCGTTGGFYTKSSM